MTEPHASQVGKEPVDPLPALERAVADRPDDAKALVALANHYWLIGAGPEAVGDLASRAIASDPDNRAGWHLWALAESNPRERVARWQQVSSRFPDDQLARAHLGGDAGRLAPVGARGIESEGARGALAAGVVALSGRPAREGESC